MNDTWYTTLVMKRAELGYLLNELELLGAGIEVGAALGKFSKRLLETWKGTKLYSIDAWKHQPADYYDEYNVGDAKQLEHLEAAKKKLAQFEDRSEIIKAFSQDVVSTFEDGSLDFVYIDANHSDLLADIRAWYPKVKNGGVVSGHDFVEGTIGVSNFTVKSDLRSYLEDGDDILYVTLEAWPSWIIIKGNQAMPAKYLA